MCNNNLRNITDLANSIKRIKKELEELNGRVDKLEEIKELTEELNKETSTLLNLITVGLYKEGSGIEISPLKDPLFSENPINNKYIHEITIKLSDTEEHLFFDAEGNLTFDDSFEKGTRDLIENKETGILVRLDENRAIIDGINKEINEGEESIVKDLEEIHKKINTHTLDIDDLYKKIKEGGGGDISSRVKKTGDTMSGTLVIDTPEDVTALEVPNVIKIKGNETIFKKQFSVRIENENGEEVKVFNIKRDGGLDMSRLSTNKRVFNIDSEGDLTIYKGFVNDNNINSKVLALKLGDTDGYNDTSGTLKIDNLYNVETKSYNITFKPQSEFRVHGYRKDQDYESAILKVWPGSSEGFSTGMVDIYNPHLFGDNISIRDSVNLKGDLRFIDGFNDDEIFSIRNENGDICDKDGGIYGNIIDAVKYVKDIVVEIRYEGLFNLVSNNELQPGRVYRIIDYVTKYDNLSNRKSAEHPYDLLVSAITTNKLNPIAYPIKHQGDDYFLDGVLDKTWVRYDFANNKIIQFNDEKYHISTSFDFHNLLSYIDNSWWYVFDANGTDYMNGQNIDNVFDVIIGNPTGKDISIPSMYIEVNDYIEHLRIGDYCKNVVLDVKDLYYVGIELVANTRIKINDAMYNTTFYELESSNITHKLDGCSFGKVYKCNFRMTMYGTKGGQYLEGVNINSSNEADYLTDVVLNGRYFTVKNGSSNIEINITRDGESNRVALSPRALYSPAKFLYVCKSNGDVVEVDLSLIASQSYVDSAINESENTMQELIGEIESKSGDNKKRLDQIDSDMLDMTESISNLEDTIGNVNTLLTSING